MECTEIDDPQPEACVPRPDEVVMSAFEPRTDDAGHRLRIDHHEGLPSTAPEDARVVETRNVDMSAELALAMRGRRRRDIERERRGDASHAASWPEASDVVRRASYLALGPAVVATDVARHGLAEHVLLVEAVRDYARHDEVLGRGPVGQRDDRRVPKVSSVVFARAAECHGDVPDHLRKADVAGDSIGLRRTSEEVLQMRMELRLVPC